MSDGTFLLFESMLRCNGNIRFIIFMGTILQRYWHDNCSTCDSDIWRIVGLENIPLLANWRMCEHNCKTWGMQWNKNIADSRCCRYCKSDHILYNHLWLKEPLTPNNHGSLWPRKGLLWLQWCCSFRQQPTVVSSGCKYSACEFKNMNA